MRIVSAQVVFALIALFCNDVTASHDDSEEPPLLLLISFDGFGWDFLDHLRYSGKPTPNFDRLRDNGVFVQQGVENNFMTVTWPNHYAIVTGLFAESHGIVTNDMYDAKADLHFYHKDQGNRTMPFWFSAGSETYEGFPEPIWLTNSKARDVDNSTRDGRRYSGVVNWPVGIQTTGMEPDAYVYDWGLNFTARADDLIEFFVREKNPANFGLLYYPEPDHTSHHEGPFSAKTHDKIVELDTTLGYIINKLEDHGLFSKMNLIVTADHSQVGVSGTIKIDEHVNASWYDSFGSSGPVWNIRPLDGRTACVGARKKFLKKPPTKKFIFGVSRVPRMTLPL